MALVHVADRDGVRAITFDHPPVNALSYALVVELCAALDAAAQDASVRAVVLGGARGTFSAGADIHDFAAPPAAGAPTLRDAIARIERLEKVAVAALAGNALGGALELALACDYRVAAPDARVGLPEIRLGLIPGAGGTQRLPRILGARRALELILDGGSIGAVAAMADGIVDTIAEGDLPAAAAAAAQGPKRRVSTRAAELGVPGAALFAVPWAVAQAHKAAPPESRGGYAAHRAIDAVAAALELDFERGLARERRLFGECLASPESAALRHVFSAERELDKIPGLPAAEPLPLASVGIVGAGTMGTGIALTFADAGFPVTVVEPDSRQIERARGQVAATYARSVERGRIDAAEAERRGGAIAFVPSLEALGSVDLALEAVFEDLGVKREVFAQLSAICKPGAILASNTSTLDIDALAAMTDRPESVVGLHFFAPANVMRLLEIVRGRATSAALLATAFALAKRLRKVGVLSGNAFGFIGNAMLFAYAGEAIELAEEGVPPARIDAVMKDYGLAMGPFATFDLSGLDVILRIQNARPDALPTRTPILAELCSRGRLGQKSGSGFYRYLAGRREAEADPEADGLLRTLASAAGIAVRRVEDEEIRERLLGALARSGRALLASGVALRPGDIDVVYVSGYGFPAYRGGPMWDAENRVKEPVHG